MEKDLKSRVDALNKEKEDRMRQLKQRTRVDQQLCDTLWSTPFYIAQSTVPSERQLAELEDHIRGLELEKVSKAFHFGIVGLELP